MFDVDREILDKISVWVQLPTLQLEFWNLPSLKYLGDSLGVFLKVDLSFIKTHRKYVARNLVSMNI